MPNQQSSSFLKHEQWIGSEMYENSINISSINKLQIWFCVLIAEEIILMEGNREMRRTKKK